MFGKILVPLDGSELARRVLPSVVSLARAFDSQVYLATVCEHGQTSTACKVCTPYIRGEADELQNQISDVSGRVQCNVLEGNAAKRIPVFVRKYGMELVMASSRGSSRSRQLPLGSTINGLLREQVPIIVVNAQSQNWQAGEIFDRILVPLDGSELGFSVVGPVSRISRKINTRITLLNVIEKQHSVRTIGGLDNVTYSDNDLNNRKTSSSKYLEYALSQFKGSGASIDTEIRVGTPWVEILKLAGELDVTLIAMVSHVHSVFERWFYGSVTDKILGKARRSLFLIPATN